MPPKIRKPSKRKPKFPDSTESPEIDLRNYDIRQYFDPPPINYQLDNEGRGNNSQRTVATTIKTVKQTNLQLKLTDDRLRSYIPKEKLGIFDYEPEDPELFLKKLQKVDKDEEKKLQRQKKQTTSKQSKTKNIKKRKNKNNGQTLPQLLAKNAKRESPILKLLQDSLSLELENNVEGQNWQLENNF